MLNLQRKLTDDEISTIEQWAEKKKENPSLSHQAEQQLLDRIQELKKSNWKGYRLNDGDAPATPKEEAQRKLDRLK